MKPLNNFHNIGTKLTALLSRTDLGLVFSRMNNVAHYSQVQALKALSKILLSSDPNFYGNKKLQSVVLQAKIYLVTEMMGNVG